MRAEDIRAYVGRDWEALADLKDTFWVDQRRLYGASGAMQVADELRQQVLALRPGWPSDEERDEDLATHVRVGKVLRRVDRARGD